MLTIRNSGLAPAVGTMLSWNNAQHAAIVPDPLPHPLIEAILLMLRVLIAPEIVPSDDILMVEDQLLKMQTPPTLLIQQHAPCIQVPTTLGASVAKMLAMLIAPIAIMLLLPMWLNILHEMMKMKPEMSR
ncbi:hypothetical protein ACA910_000865 [Epithemia clementina (nom. ined.)]